jgi:hypothetical protein
MLILQTRQTKGESDSRERSVQYSSNKQAGNDDSICVAKVAPEASFCQPQAYIITIRPGWNAHLLSPWHICVVCLACQFDIGRWLHYLTS